MKRFLFTIWVFLTMTRVAYADANAAACNIYSSIQSGTTIQNIQNIVSSSGEPQSLQINQGYRWVFDNGDVAYVEFDSNGNLAGPKELRSVAQDTSDAETEFNEDLSDNTLTLSLANSLLSPGEFVEYDFIDTFNDGTTIKGFADKNGQVLATSVHPACSDNTEDSKNFMNSDAEAPNIYEQSNDSDNDNANANPPDEAQPVVFAAVLPYFLYTPNTNYQNRSNHHWFGSHKKSHQHATSGPSQNVTPTHSFTTNNLRIPTAPPVATTSPPVTPAVSGHPEPHSQFHHH